MFHILILCASVLLSERNMCDDMLSCFRFTGMCLDKVGQSRLGTVGVTKVVLTSLYRFEKTSEYLTLLCVSLISVLASGSSVNQQKLGQ